MRYKVIFFLLIAFGFICKPDLKGQEKQSPARNDLLLGPLMLVGQVLDIYAGLPAHGLSAGIDLSIAWQTTGKQYWNQHYRFPQTGLIISCMNFGNPDELGYEFSLVPNLSYQLMQTGKWTLFGVIGFGFAAFNKPYDRIENPSNKFVGSAITNKSIFGLDLDFQWARALYLSTGISYLHYSNGHYQLPNVGINIPAIRLGFKYFPNKLSGIRFNREPYDSFNRNWMFNVRLGLGMHEFGDPVKPTGGPKYSVYSGSLYLTKRTGIVTNFHAGLHANYYSSFYDYILAEETYQYDQRIKSITLITFGGIEFLMGHLSFSGQMGVYLYNPFFREIQKIRSSDTGFKDTVKQYLSYRFGSQFYLFNTRYPACPNPWIGLFLKTNAGQADFTEISIGCAF